MICNICMKKTKPVYIQLHTGYQHIVYYIKLQRIIQHRVNTLLCRYIPSTGIKNEKLKKRGSKKFAVLNITLCDAKKLPNKPLHPVCVIRYIFFFFLFY